VNTFAQRLSDGRCSAFHLLSLSGVENEVTLTISSNSSLSLITVEGALLLNQSKQA